MAEGKRRFVFGVDLDGVVTDFYRGLRPFAAEWLGVPEADLPLDVTYGLPEWNLNAMGGYEPLHRFAVTQRGLFEKLEPIEGAPAALRRLSHANVRVRIITHRLFINFFHREAIDQTIAWLERYAVPYSDLCFMENKSDVGANIYIEDAPHNITRLREHGSEVIIYSNSTNRNLVGLRANSWAEVEAIVLGKQAAHLAGQDA